MHVRLSLMYKKILSTCSKGHLQIGRWGDTGRNYEHNRDKILRGSCYLNFQFINFYTMPTRFFPPDICCLVKDSHRKKILQDF